MKIFKKEKPKTKAVKPSCSIEDKYVGQRLKLRRSQLGVSQTDFARFEKLSFQQIQKYESGKNRIASGRLYRFAKILHVKMDYFYDGMEDFLDSLEGNKSARAKVKAIIIDDKRSLDIRKLNKFFLKIENQRGRNAVIATARVLSEKDKVGGKGE